MTGMLPNEHSTRRPHNAIHDLESFFWVLTYLCLTRQGPGGQRRNELMPAESCLPENEPIVRPYYCFFGDENIMNMAHNKRILFQKNHYEEYVLERIHPYFFPLKPLLLKWWKILRLGYRYPVFEAVHNAFLDALKETIETLKMQPSIGEGDDTAAVDAQRREDLVSLQYFPDGIGENSEEVNLLSTTSELSPSRDLDKTSVVGKDYTGNFTRGQSPASPTPPSREAKRPRVVG